MPLQTDIIKKIIEKGNDGFNIIERRNYITDILQLFGIRTICDDGHDLTLIRTKITIPGRNQFISTVYTHNKFIKDEVVMETAWFYSDHEKKNYKFITPEDNDRFCIHKYYSIGEYIDNILKMYNYYKSIK